MIENLIAAPQLTMLDTILFFRDTAHPVALVSKDGPVWMNKKHRSPRAVMPAVFPSLALFRAQRKDLQDHPLRIAVMLMCSPDECASHGLTAHLCTRWNDAVLHELLTPEPIRAAARVELTEAVSRDLAAETTALKPYPSGKIVSSVHPLFYRIPDKARRAELQYQVWGWLAGVLKAKPVTSFPIMQRFLDTAEALELRRATIFNQTHSTAETLIAFPTVDEFALGFLRSAVNPKKRKVPSTGNVARPKPR